LYVKIPGNGYGKINSANVDGGPALAEQVVSSVIGVPIHYYIQLDFDGFKQAVDAVGGVDINVKTALYDPAYPCETGYKYCPYRQPAGQIHMTGLMALRYSRCRHDDPYTGANCGNDQGRSARQQEVLTALRLKTLSAGTLTNPLKLVGLIDTVGDHVKTDLQPNDIKQLALIAKDVNTSNIVNKVLNFSGPDAVLTATSNEAGSVLVPRLGTFNYTEIQNLAHSIFVDHYITDENALVQVQNGSGITGLAGGVVTSLKASHYNVMDATTAAQNYAKTVIYDNSSGKKPYTVNYLQEKFGVTAIQGVPPTAAPVTPSSSTPASTQNPDIVIILGTDYSTSASASTTKSSGQ
jgi:LCP family protein required for cell wall assembly